MKLLNVFNSKLGQWSIYHDQWCNPGQTSVVMRTITGNDYNAEKKLVEAICEGFNALPEARRVEALKDIVNDTLDARLPRKRRA